MSVDADRLLAIYDLLDDADETEPDGVTELWLAAKWHEQEHRRLRKELLAWMRWWKSQDEAGRFAYPAPIATTRELLHVEQWPRTPKQELIVRECGAHEDGAGGPCICDALGEIYDLAAPQAVGESR